MQAEKCFFGLPLKTYFWYLIPSMLGMALVAVYTFTDTFVVGRELGTRGARSNGRMHAYHYDNLRSGFLISR